MVTTDPTSLAMMLHKLLQSMEATCLRLEDVLQQERLAVQSFNGEALAALTEAHISCHQELAEMERQCRELLQQQGIPDNMGLEAFIDVHMPQEARRLQSIRRKLYERLSHAVHASDVNRQSMRIAYEASSAVLQYIGAIPGKSTYGPGGTLR